jgi:hypothetical protein
MPKERKRHGMGHQQEKQQQQEEDPPTPPQRGPTQATNSAACLRAVSPSTTGEKPRGKPQKTRANGDKRKNDVGQHEREDDQGKSQRGASAARNETHHFSCTSSFDSFCSLGGFAQRDGEEEGERGKKKGERGKKRERKEKRGSDKNGRSRNFSETPPKSTL